MRNNCRGIFNEVLQNIRIHVFQHGFCMEFIPLSLFNDIYLLTNCHIIVLIVQQLLYNAWRLLDCEMLLFLSSICLIF